MQSNLYLLGSESTFLGVIATLVILCITRSNNNFMFYILHNIKKGIFEYIKQMKPVVSIHKIKNNSHYKAVLYYIKSNRTSKNKSKDTLLNRCYNRIVEVDEICLHNQNKLTNWEIKYSNFADAIEKKPEQQMAPLFIFAYIIVVFICDEILHFPLLVEYHIKTLNFIVILSILIGIFWALKWLVFLIKSQTTDMENHFSGPVNFSRVLLTIFIHLLSSFFSIFIYKHWISLLFGFNVWILHIIWVSIYILFGIIHVIKTNKCSNKNYEIHYTYHFMYMSFYAIIMSIYIQSITNCTICGTSIELNSFIEIVRLLIWTNILFFGFIFPFALPFCKYNFILLKALTKRIFYCCYFKYMQYKLNDGLKKLAAELPK